MQLDSDTNEIISKKKNAAHQSSANNSFDVTLACLQKRGIFSYSMK